jgi:simple sugar transport system permease protein
MSSGKGYIALAAMIFGRWTPLGGVGAALLFGFTFELQSILSTVNVPIPSYFLLMVPYVATIIAVAGLVGQVKPPAADGQPYITS